MTYADVLRPADRQRALAYDVLLVIGGSLLVALFAQITVQTQPVPITGQTFAVLLVGALLGSRRGAAALTAYLVEGASGLPVFAGASGGIVKVVGPTGGYLIGFIVAAFVVGLLAERGWDRTVHMTALAMLIGNAIIYIFGLPWLAWVLKTDFQTTLAYGITPFLVWDVIKLVAAVILLPLGWRFIGERASASKD